MPSRFDDSAKRLPHFLDPFCAPFLHVYLRSRLSHDTHLSFWLWMVRNRDLRRPAARNGRAEKVSAALEMELFKRLHMSGAFDSGIEELQITRFSDLPFEQFRQWTETSFQKDAKRPPHCIKTSLLDVGFRRCLSHDTHLIFSPWMIRHRDLHQSLLLVASPSPHSIAQCKVQQIMPPHFFAAVESL